MNKNELLNKLNKNKWKNPKDKELIKLTIDHLWDVNDILNDLVVREYLLDIMKQENLVGYKAIRRNMRKKPSNVSYTDREVEDIKSFYKNNYSMEEMFWRYIVEPNTLTIIADVITKEKVNPSLFKGDKNEKDKK